MARMQCECGNSLSNNVFPNTMEGEIKGLYEYQHHDVWECLECGRLQIDVKNKEGLTISKSYIPEDGEIGNLFDVGTGEQVIEHLKKEWGLWKNEFTKIDQGFFD